MKHRAPRCIYISWTKAPLAASGFTLLELLSVVAIMGIMFCLLMPALGITKSRSLNRAGGELSNLLSFARQNAVTKSALTAMVMISTEGMAENARAFSVFELNPGNGANRSSSNWRQITAWKTMPEGIVVDECTFPEGAGNVAPALPPLVKSGIPVSSFKAVVFLPSGGLMDGRTENVRLVEGYIAKDSSALIYTGGNGNLPADYYNIAILGATSRQKIERP